MEKIYSTPVKNYIQRNGFVMVSNLLLDFQQELGITESELSFIIKIMKNKNGYAIHDKDLDPTVCTKTLSRKRNSLKEKGLLNFSIIKSQDLITGTFKTDGISYDLSPLEEKLQIISDNIESKREKEIKQHLTKQNKIVETNENSPLETFKKDYLNYYGVEYILNDFEIKKYNSLSAEEKNMIGYIFNYCSDNGLFGKIVPRLSLFFKTKFRFEDLKKYCEENGYNSSQEIINEDIINKHTNNICNKYNVKDNYAFKEAIKRILYRYINKDNTLPNGIERLFDKAYEDIIGVKKC
jgi:hypothetical protein